MCELLGFWVLPFSYSPCSALDHAQACMSVMLQQNNFSRRI